MSDQSAAPAPPSPAAQQAQAEALARLLADPHATDIYIAYLNQRMEAARRQKTIQYLTLWVPALVGILGLIGVFVSDYVIDKASERVRQSVQDERIEGALADLNRELLLQRLAVNAVTLDLKTKIDTSLADEALDQLIRIAEVPTLRARNDFRYVLERVTVAFIEFGLTEHVVRIADLYPEEISANANTVGRIAAYLAERSLGNAMPFERWPDGEAARIALFLEASHRQNVPHEILAYEALVEYSRAGSSAVTQAMISQLDDFSYADQAYVLEDFVSLAKAGMRSDHVDAGTHRLADLTRAFVADHRDQLNAYLKQVAVQEELLYLADGFRDSNSERSRAIRDTVANGF
jgi:hypothetical protein